MFRRENTLRNGFMLQFECIIYVRAAESEYSRFVWDGESVQNETK